MEQNPQTTNNISFISQPSSTSSLSKTKREVVSATVRFQQKEDNWDLFVHSYLQMCKNALSLVDVNDEKSKQTLVSIIYNVKHALEIAIKYFRRSLSEDFEDKGNNWGKRGHEIKELFFNLRERLLNKKASDKELETLLDQFQEVIIKYYELTVLKEHIRKNIDIYDYQNTFFRYPENKGLEVDFRKVVKDIPESFISELNLDIDRIGTILTSLKEKVVKI